MVGERTSDLPGKKQDALGGLNDIRNDLVKMMPVPTTPWKHHPLVEHTNGRVDWARTSVDIRFLPCHALGGCA